MATVHTGGFGRRSSLATGRYFPAETTVSLRDLINEGAFRPAFERVRALLSLEEGEEEGYCAPCSESFVRAVSILVVLAVFDVEPQIIAPSPERGIIFEFLSPDEVFASIEVLDSGDVVGAIDFGGESEPEAWDMDAAGIGRSLLRVMSALHGRA